MVTAVFGSGATRVAIKTSLSTAPRGERKWRSEREREREREREKPKWGSGAYLTWPLFWGGGEG